MKIWMLSLLALLPFLTTSCEYVDFYDMYERSEVNVVYEWDKVGEKPKAMRLVLYPADMYTKDKIKQGYMVYDLSSNGKRLSLPVGKYHVTTWNTDVSHTFFENEKDRMNLSASTTTIKKETDVRPSVVDSLFGHKPLLHSPEYLVRENQDLFTIYADRESQTLVLRPDSMLSKVSLEVTGIKNLSLATKVSAAIGMIPSRGYIADTTRTEAPAVWMFDCQARASSNQVLGDFYSFDMSKFEGGSPTDLCIFIWTPTGNVYIPLKVRIPKEELDDRFIHIKLRVNIDIKDYVTKQDGFDVDVEDWKDVEIEIPL